MGLHLYEDRAESKMITAIVEVRHIEDDQGDYDDADLVSVDADQRFDDEHRSEYDWFMDDHWIYAGSDCFWPKGLPDPGVYRVKFRIEGWWTPSTPMGPAEYDEELKIHSIDRMETKDLLDEIRRLVGEATRRSMDQEAQEESA